jgi:hypothetical protein
MAKIAINPAAPATSPSSQELTAPASSHELAVGIPGQFEGEFTSRDFAIPSLVVCQKSGKLMDDNPAWLGHLIYDKCLDLGASAKAVFFRVKRYFIEDLPFGSDGIPRKFDTVAEAREAGVDVADIAELDCLIQVPADFDGGEQIGDAHYAPARYTVRSTAFRATVPILRKDVSLRLKGNLAAGVYTISAVKKTYGPNSWFAPQLAAAGATPDVVLQYIAEKLA